MNIPFDHITIPPNHRPRDPQVVDKLSQSIDQVGLLQPIGLRETASPDQYEVVYGAHRLEAVKKLGHAGLEPRDFRFVQCHEDGEGEYHLQTISENLFRKELSDLERAEQEAEYVELLASRSRNGDGDHTSVQNCTELRLEPSVQNCTEAVQAATPRGSTTKTAKAIGRPRERVSESRKIANGLTPEAKAAAKDAGLKRPALLKVARCPPEQQVEEVRRLQQKRKRCKQPTDEGRQVTPLVDNFEQYVRALLTLTKDKKTRNFVGADIAVGDLDRLAKFLTGVAAEAKRREGGA